MYHNLKQKGGKKKVKQLIKIAEENGWKYHHTTGDHRIFKKAGQRPVVIPGHLNKDLPIGTANNILKRVRGD